MLGLCYMLCQYVIVLDHLMSYNGKQNCIYDGVSMFTYIYVCSDGPCYYRQSHDDPTIYLSITIRHMAGMVYASQEQFDIWQSYHDLTMYLSRTIRL